MLSYLHLQMNDTTSR